MNAPNPAPASLVHQWRGRALRVGLRLAAAVAIGFTGGTIGYFQYMSRMIALRPAVAVNSDRDSDGYLDVVVVANGNVFIPVRTFGFGDFCLAGIYATGFGLLARRTPGRLAGAGVGFALLFAGLQLRGRL